MINIISKRAIYAKGTASVVFFDWKTDEVLYSNNKLQTSQIQTSINLGPIQGGIGNATLINIPDTPNLTVNMTAADFSLDVQGLQNGSVPHFNAVVPITESVKCTAGKLTVTGIPVAPLGTTTGKITATINNVAYEFGTGVNSKAITFPSGTEGEAYCVSYNVQKLQSQQIDLKTVFAPAVVRSIITIPLFGTENANPKTGSKAGYLYVTVPRLQLNGDINIEGSQTTATTTVMNASALSFDEYFSSNGDACASNEPKLAYMSVDLLDVDTYDNVASLVVIGGGVAGATGDIVELPIKALMKDGSTENLPNYADFTFKATPDTTGTIDPQTGKLTIKTTGGVVKVTPNAAINRPDLTATVAVTI